MAALSLRASQPGQRPDGVSRNDTYYAVDVDDGVVASVSFFEDPAGREESNGMAADFVREDLASLLPNPPGIANAGVIGCGAA
jgi:hypothetical protein